MAEKPRKEREIWPIILFEIKKEVSTHLRRVNAKHLAQTIVEGYYLMMGSLQQINHVVVALTDVANTHYFRLRLATPTGGRKELEVDWHHCVAFKEWMPTGPQEVVDFVNHLHDILCECLAT